MIRAMAKALVAAFVLIALKPVGATAHKVAEGWFDMWYSAPNCLKQKSTIDHSGGTGIYVLSEVRAVRDAVHPWGTWHCVNDWTRPAGHLRARFILYYNSGSSVCHWGDWRYSQGSTFYVARQRAWSGRPCGAGWYGNHTGGQVYWNGAWRPDAHLFSGWHYF